MSKPDRMPAVFFGHGSPMTAFEEANPYVAAWRELGRRLPRPKAILVISGHWYGPGVAVTAMDRPPTIHDFYGFPEQLYRFRYEAPGSPELAARAAELMAPTQVAQTDRWGLDHGAWTVLMHAFPDADIPVVQLSLDRGLTPAQHYALGEKLRPLRDEGVLMMGTGNIVHNLRIFDRSGRSPPNPVAEGFRRKITTAFREHDKSALIGALEDPAARLAAPTPDHFLPVLYVAAMQDADEDPTFITEVTEGGGVDMTTVVLGGERLAA
ncbi:MAG TPA: 4,5-DOPA dioxygenase extradiol [Caulobacteraceae bacterium]|jgi:4,5-DOPA dioxygenase extradiol|nr:4,5-DOPA dioxygenase extradiol [Caulobacteraceae bacterium]